MAAKKTRALALPQQRVRAHLLAGSSAHTPADVVKHMGAVQAQDYLACQWAIGLRLAPAAPATEALVARALADAALIRTHLFRGTWQLVTPADVRWMLALVGPRIIAGAARRSAELALDPATYRKSNATLAKALLHRTQLTRDDVAAVLQANGIATDGQRLSHLLAHAELSGVICCTTQARYALLDERAPSSSAAAAPLSRAEALHELASRYVRSRGPATLADFTWWTGLAAAEAREAFASVADEERAAGAAGASGALLLPAFDEYLVGYKTRADVLDPAHAKRVNAGGGLLRPVVVVDGAVVGTWARTLLDGKAGAAVDVNVVLLGRPVPRAVVEPAVERYARFLGRSLRALTLISGGSARRR